MLDRDLAALYGVATFRLNEAIKRNRQRFPDDFMFQINVEELRDIMSLTSQSAISNAGRGGRRTMPFAFTEHGVAMLSSVLNSDRAIEVNIAIIRAFVRMRSLISHNKELSRKIEDLDRNYSRHDSELKVIFNTLRQLMDPPTVPPKRRIGFRSS